MLPGVESAPTAGLAVGVGLVGLGLYGLVRTLRRARAGDGPRVHADRAAVDCESCGAENGLEYRFCWDCADPLPSVRGDPEGEEPGGSTPR